MLKLNADERRHSKNEKQFPVNAYTFFRRMALPLCN